MKRIYKIFSPLLASLLLVGCTGNSSNSITPSDSSSDSTSSEDTSISSPTPTIAEDSITIHYSRKDNSYDDWALWLWPVGGDGQEYPFNGIDDYGAVANYPFSTWEGQDVKENGLGFIIKSAGSWASKDVDGDRFIDFAELKPDDRGVYDIYLKSGDVNIYLTPDCQVLPKIKNAYFLNEKTVLVQHNSEVVKVRLLEDGKEIYNNESSGKKNYRIILNNPMDFKKNYIIESTFKTGEVLTKSISKTSLYDSETFDAKYTYDGNDLGAIVNNGTTSFKVWSPFSTEMILKVYDSGTPETYKNLDPNATDTPYKEVKMVQGDKGVWATTIDEDLSGKYYTYTATTAKYDSREVADPYAKSTGINGQRGMIVDFSKTNPEGWDEIKVHPYDRNELTVYETHVSDLTSSKTWNGKKENAKKFKGAYETGTTYTKGDVTVKTGFDHIKELGVNAVQLQPIFDQANDETKMEFNWGYNPQNYNTLEGSYSSNPFDGYQRIKEFKELVKAYNEADINIIMDVVYNHMAGADFSNFDVLVNDYYFRHTYDGGLSNGSGCGNETASNLPMFRKFMIDSTAFLAKEYKLGGFRFDLMGLHDIDTMNKLVANLKTINPDICVYGEPWTGGSTPLDTYEQAIQANGSRFEGYGQFNDQMRDALIAGGLHSKTDLGWIDDTKESSIANISSIVYGIKGFTDTRIDDPNKTVNYVTCHDNYTLYDRFKAAGIKDEDDIKKMAMLANSVVFTSQGTTFMLAGEEFLRTKGGNSNSYNASYEVNELNYELKVDNKDMFDNYVKLINLKQSVDGLHLQNKKDDVNASAKRINVEVSEDNTILKYTLKDTTNNKEYIICHRCGANSSNEVKIDLTGYQIYLSTLDSSKQASATTNLLPFETIIAVR